MAAYRRTFNDTECGSLTASWDGYRWWLMMDHGDTHRWRGRSCLAGESGVMDECTEPRLNRCDAAGISLQRAGVGHGRFLIRPAIRNYMISDMITQRVILLTGIRCKKRCLQQECGLFHFSETSANVEVITPRPRT